MLISLSVLKIHQFYMFVAGTFCDLKNGLTMLVQPLTVVGFIPSCPLRDGDTECPDGAVQVDVIVVFLMDGPELSV